MKVDLNALTALQAAEQSAVDRAKNAKSTTTDASAVTSASTEDQSSFQQTFPSVATLAAQAQGVPAVRQEKVDALKQQVADGSYKLDADNIVSALITNGGR